MSSSIIFPAEWESHSAVWTAWPSAAALWKENLEPAREEAALFFRAIAQPDPEQAERRGEIVKVLYNGDEARDSARAAMGDLIDTGQVQLFDADLGDVWLRDTGPLFVKKEGALAATGFSFNGWGGKYLIGSDVKMASIVARLEGHDVKRHPYIIEGGAVESDGAGTLITTRQCLLNKNRNPNASQKDIEAALHETLGAGNIIWLDEGLMNDHTDGHVDNIARFLRPGVIGCMHPMDNNDPNAAVYKAIYKTLSKAVDADGKRFEVVEIPSPGKVTDEEGAVVPASHMNFYIANHSVIIPSYAETDAQREAADEATDIIGVEVGREDIYAIDARAILTGGGSFHCITQQVPAL